MAKTVAAFIQENKSVFKALVNARQIPMSSVRKFQIYLYYSGLTSKSKMGKYKDTAKAMGSNLTDVRNSIKEMEKSI